METRSSGDGDGEDLGVAGVEAGEAGVEAGGRSMFTFNLLLQSHVLLCPASDSNKRILSKAAE